ncbi:hypothetical protein PR048_030063 [Dryococelus australis]|uniref:Uncharacterized protein n=1 Tax=Dryococelus australis TaxID=614101 RepID=A0ABQ9G7W9_9NEOP|nr:hypothetical protein PR048_030063 [Dryococelus australis]
MPRSSTGSRLLPLCRQQKCLGPALALGNGRDEDRALTGPRCFLTANGLRAMWEVSKDAPLYKIGALLSNQLACQLSGSCVDRARVYHFAYSAVLDSSERQQMSTLGWSGAGMQECDGGGNGKPAGKRHHPVKIRECTRRESKPDRCGGRFGNWTRPNFRGRFHTGFRTWPITSQFQIIAYLKRSKGRRFAPRCLRYGRSSDRLSRWAFVSKSVSLELRQRQMSQQRQIKNNQKKNITVVKSTTEVYVFGKQFSYFNQPLRIRKHQHGSYVIRVQTVNTCPRVIQPIKAGADGRTAFRHLGGKLRHSARACCVSSRSKQLLHLCITKYSATKSVPRVTDLANFSVISTLASHQGEPSSIQSLVGSPDFRDWESCRALPLVGGFSRGSPVSPAPSFRRHFIFTSITLVGSQDLAVKSRPNLFTHSPSDKEIFKTDLLELHWSVVLNYSFTTETLAHRSDEALGVSATVARIAPSLFDLGRAPTYLACCQVSPGTARGSVMCQQCREDFWDSCNTAQALILRVAAVFAAALSVNGGDTALMSGPGSGIASQPALRCLPSRATEAGLAGTKQCVQRGRLKAVARVAGNSFLYAGARNISPRARYVFQEKNYHPVYLSPLTLQNDFHSVDIRKSRTGTVVVRDWLTGVTWSMRRTREEGGQSKFRGLQQPRGAHTWRTLQNDFHSVDIRKSRTGTVVVRDWLTGSKFRGLQQPRGAHTWRTLQNDFHSVDIRKSRTGTVVVRDWLTGSKFRGLQQPRGAHTWRTLQNDFHSVDIRKSRTGTVVVRDWLTGSKFRGLQQPRGAHTWRTLQNDFHSVDIRKSRTGTVVVRDWLTGFRGLQQPRGAHTWRTAGMPSGREAWSSLNEPPSQRRLDSTVTCILEPQMFVHWLLPHGVDSVTSHLAVRHSLLVSLQVCYWLTVVQGVSNNLRSNYKVHFSVHVFDVYLVLK